MAVGLLGSALVVGWAAARLLHRELDDALSAAASLVSEVYECCDAFAVGDTAASATPSGFGPAVNRYVVVRTLSGQPIRALPRSAMELPLDSTALREAGAGRGAFSTGRWLGGPVRSAYRSVAMGGRPGGYIAQVAASLDPIYNTERRVTLLLIGIVLLGGVATLAGAWRFVGSAVGPVAEITEHALRIEAGTLNQRISAHATTEEYRGLVAVLNRMLARLEASFRTQQRFTGDVSHELRTPLTALRGEIEVALRAERAPADYQRVLWSALEEIERLTSTVEDLLLITRVESHLVTPQRALVDLHPVVQRVLDQLRERIDERQLRIEVLQDSPSCTATVDPVLVTRLVMSLIDNAVKFTPPGGWVRVVTGVSDSGGARLRVENSGPPIAAEDLPHLFEPFYRADRARSRGTGTGMGLAVAAAIARVHGGEIRAANMDGEGVAFAVDLATQREP
jgi:two-component system OmpR family sensor kinase